MSIVFKSNIDRFIRAIERDDDNAIESFRKGLRDGMYAFESHLVRTQFTGRPGLQRQTGNAANSWRIRFAKSGGKETVVQMGSSAWYVERFETGKPIIAKPGKALAIPLKKELQGVSPRSIPGLFILPRREEGKAPLLVRKRGDNGLEALYVLKKRVESPRYLHVRDSFRKDGRRLLLRSIHAQIRRWAGRGR